MRRTSASASIAAVFVAVALGGCGSEAASSSGSASQPSADESTSAAAPSEPADPSEPSEPSQSADPAPDTVTVEISIEGGDVDPAGKQVAATVGQTVVLAVDSDAAEELHVHSAPDEHSFAVKPKQNQRFSFTVEQPGQFDVEAHGTGVLVAQLVVRP